MLYDYRWFCPSKWLGENYLIILKYLISGGIQVIQQLPKWSKHLKEERNQEPLNLNQMFQLCPTFVMPWCDYISPVTAAPDHPRPSAAISMWCLPLKLNLSTCTYLCRWILFSRINCCFILKWTTFRICYVEKDGKIDLLLTS